jgi:hypothetical protein
MLNEENRVILVFFYCLLSESLVCSVLATDVEKFRFDFLILVGAYGVSLTL